MEKNKMRYPLSTSVHFFLDKDYNVSMADQVRRIANAGFKYLDFNFLDWSADIRSPFVGENWLKWAAEAGNAAAESGAIFNQAHAPVYDGIRYKGCTDEDMTEYMKRAIIACAELKIPQMVWHPLWTLPENSDQININYEAYAPLVEMSEKYGVGVAFENVWQTRRKTPLRNTDTLIEFVDGWKDENVGICWDFGHGFITDGGTDIENDPYVNLKKIGRRLKATHVHDNCGKCDDHIAPFDGNINWERVMRALYEIDYKYSFTYEAHNAVVRIPKEAPLIADKKLRYLYELGVTLVSWDSEKGFVDSELNL